MWAHEYSGTTEGIGEHTRPMRATQWLKETHLIYSSILLIFLHVGLCCSFFFAGDVAHRGASNLTRKMTRVDQVDFGPPDLDQTHVTNAPSSISLTKSDGCDHS